MDHSRPSSNSEHISGALFVVATPIGNMEDITLRALKIFRQVDLIAAEDTRRTGRLLEHHKISSRLISYHEHNEEKRSGELITVLKEGKKIALASSAGTPSVSDPGYRLIKKCIAENIPVTPIPGVSSAVAGLSVSGLSTDSFVFLGFAPRKPGKREKFFNSLASQPRTMIFFESPKRILKLVEDLIGIMGDRRGVLAREMTKVHEEFIRGSLSQIKNQIKFKGEIKGECTLLVNGADLKNQFSEDLLRLEIQKEMKNSREKLSFIVKKISSRFGISRKKVYDEAIRLKNRG